MRVLLEKCAGYEQPIIDSILKRWLSLLKDFIRPYDTLVLKPYCLSHSHKYNENEWDSIGKKSLVSEMPFK